MTISIFLLSLKGGIGKSKFAYKLSKLLSRNFLSVLLIDNDSLHTLSTILGHYGNGLLDGCEISSSLKKIDDFYLLKLRDNPISVLYDERYDRLRSVLSKKWDFIVIDNYIGINESNAFVKNVYEVSERKIGIFLTDYLTLDNTFNYMRIWYNLDHKFVVLINENNNYNYSYDQLLSTIL